jgi:hypothetical protein
LTDYHVEHVAKSRTLHVFVPRPMNKASNLRISRVWTRLHGKETCPRAEGTGHKLVDWITGRPITWQ